jgi:hypothetical protein
MNTHPRPAADATFHEGEIALQERAGARAEVAAYGPRLIREQMPDQHRAFFAQLPTLVMGGLSAEGRPWATMLAGPPGFLSTPDARTLRVAATDVRTASLTPGAPVGLLGIEPHTRRRNRLNGVITAVEAGGFTVGVQQSFGNCPKYIQARVPAFVAAGPAPAPRPFGPTLPEALRTLVADADTFFLASASPEARGQAGPHGVDVSHRGGKPGFVRVEASAAGTVLTVPDFSGNNMFNTLGNLALLPHAGLLFLDHASGGLLELAVDAEIVDAGAEVRAFRGAERLLRLQVRAGVWREAALPLRWSAPVLAPHLAATGAWSG